jgi:hypothetical protein
VRSGSSNARRGLAAALGLAALAVTARLHAAELGWSAPDACQRADVVRSQVESLIGRSLAEIEAPSFEVTITQKGDTWSLELVTLAPARSSRTLKGPSCVAVTDAAGVAMALAIRATTETAPDGPPASETQAEAAPSPPPPDAAPDAAPVAPPEPAEPVAQRGDARFGAVVGLGVTVDAATLPAPVLGLAAHAGLRLASLRLELQGLAFAPSTLELADEQSAEFTLFSGALLGCFAGPLPTLTVLGCAGAELGRLAGEGQGVTDPELGSALWQAARIEGGVELPISAGLRLSARLGAAVPLARPEFQLDGNTVHRPASMTLRAALGVILLP